MEDQLVDGMEAADEDDPDMDIYLEVEEQALLTGEDNDRDGPASPATPIASPEASAESPQHSPAANNLYPFERSAVPILTYKSTEQITP